MQLNEELLNDCEEFFDLIANEEESADLTQAIASLKSFLERDVDGWTCHDEERLARAVQCRISEIWRLISRAEKRNSPDLEYYYEEIINRLEDLSEYETDDSFDDEDFEGEL